MGLKPRRGLCFKLIRWLKPTGIDTLLNVIKYKKRISKGFLYYHLHQLKVIEIPRFLVALAIYKLCNKNTKQKSSKNNNREDKNYELG